MEFHQVYALTVQGYIPLLIDTLDPEENVVDNYLSQFRIFSHQNITYANREKSLAPWFNKKRFSVMYDCELCVQEKPEPYYRLHWRFPWMTSCPIHKVILKKTSFYGMLCKNLKFFFWDDNKAIVMPKGTLDNLYHMDYLTLQAVTLGMVDLPSEKMHGGVWVRILRTLIEEFGMPIAKMNRKSQNLIRSFWGKYYHCVRPRLRSYRAFEYCDFNQQFDLMFLAASPSTVKNLRNLIRANNEDDRVLESWDRSLRRLGIPFDEMGG